MKIICIARNYAAHAEELDRQVGGGTPCPPEPAWFLKPDTALLRNNDPFYIPAFSQEVHYECELVVRINRVGKGIAERFAHRYYDQVGLGIDFTARDLQRQAIAEGLPWERCKAFDRSAALSPQFVSLQELGGDVQSPAFHAGGERPDAPAGRHVRDALLCRPDHRLGVAVHDAAHGRPALHGHAGRRGTRTPGRQSARRARRPRTAQLRHPLTRERRHMKTKTCYNHVTQRQTQALPPSAGIAVAAPTGTDDGLRAPVRTRPQIRMRGGGSPRRHARRRGAALPLAAQERSLPGGAGPERNPADGRHGSGLRRRGARQTSRPRRGRADAPPPLGAPAHGGLGRHAAYPRADAHLRRQELRMVPAARGRGDRLLPRRLPSLRQGRLVRHPGSGSATPPSKRSTARSTMSWGSRFRKYTPNSTNSSNK